jgi:hypothetical protein
MVPLTRERGTQEFYINNVKHGTINKRDGNKGKTHVFPSLLLMVPCFTLFI